MRAPLREALNSHLICANSVLALSCGLLFILPVALDARSRDADASRMQARKVAFPSSHSDSLAPPEDRVDWTYFKLSQSSRVSISVEFDTPNVGGRLILAGATGRERASAADENARLNESLEPGVYYVSVSSSKPTSYKLSID